ncbi:MAG: YDG domain-containing protein [Christensenellaceae bacterium]|jgi:hypothetical protein|nr:YDG domain-containing protein [Christensenellaceae bacterium]
MRLSSSSYSSRNVYTNYQANCAYSKTIGNRHLNFLIIIFFVTFTIVLGILGVDKYFLADAASSPSKAGNLSSYEYDVTYIAGLYPARTDGGGVNATASVNKYIDGLDPAYDNYYLTTSGAYWPNNDGTYYSKKMGGYNRANTGTYLTNATDTSVNSTAAFDPGSASHSYIILDLKRVVPVSRVIYKTIDSSVSGFYFDNILTYGVWTSDYNHFQDYIEPSDLLNLKTRGLFKNVYQNTVSSYDNEDNKKYYPTSNTSVSNERNQNIITRKNTNSVVSEFSDEARVMDFDTVYARYIAIQVDECWYLNYMKVQQITVWGEIGAANSTLGYMYDIVHAPSQYWDANLDNLKPGIPGSYIAPNYDIDSCINSYYTYVHYKYNYEIKTYLETDNNKNYIIIDLGAVRPISRIRITPRDTSDTIIHAKIYAGNNSVPIEQQPLSFFTSLNKFTEIAEYKYMNGAYNKNSNRPPKKSNSIFYINFPVVYTRYVAFQCVDVDQLGVEWQYFSMAEFIISDWDVSDYISTGELTSADVDTLRNISSAKYGYGEGFDYKIAFAPDSDTTYPVNLINDGKTGTLSTLYHSAHDNSKARYNESQYGLYNQNTDPDNLNLDKPIIHVNKDSYIVIDLETTRLVSGLIYTARNDGRNGSILNYEVYLDINLEDETSNIKNSKLLKIGRENTHFVRVATGTFSYTLSSGKPTNPEQTVNFTLTKARYVVLRALSTDGDNSTYQNQYISCSELKILGANVIEIKTKEDLWKNVSDRNHHTGVYLLANDITVTGLGYNRLYGTDFSTGDARKQITISYGGAYYREYAEHTQANKKGETFDKPNNLKNWFSGYLFGNNKTISYVLDWPKKDNMHNYSTIQIIASLERDGYTDEGYANSYHGLLTGQMYGGHIRDLTIAVNKSLILGNGDSQKYFSFSFGVVTGLARNNSTITNVTVQLNASITFAGQRLNNGDTGIGITLGGFVGQATNQVYYEKSSAISNTPLTIRDSTLKMSSNVMLYAMSVMWEYNYPRSYGIQKLGARVGGFLGEVTAYTHGSDNASVVYMYDCKIQGHSTSVIGAYHWMHNHLMSAAGGVVGAIQQVESTSANATLSMDGLIYDYEGLILSNYNGENNNTFPTGSAYNNGAGFIAGFKAHGCTLNNNNTVKGFFLNITVPKGITPRIITLAKDMASYADNSLDSVNASYRNSSDPALASRRFIRAIDTYKVISKMPSGSTTYQLWGRRHEVVLNDSHTMVNVGFADLWIGAADEVNVVNSSDTSNLKRADVDSIYVGNDSTKLATSYTPKIKYNDIKQGRLFTTYSMDYGEDVCFSAIKIDTNTTLIYDAIAASWPVIYSKNLTTIPKAYAMYYTDAYVELTDNGSTQTLTSISDSENPEKEILSYTKTYDKQTVKILYKYASTFTGLNIVSSQYLIETDKSGASSIILSNSKTIEYTLSNYQASTHYNNNGYYEVLIYDSMEYTQSKNNGKPAYGRYFGDGMMFLDSKEIPTHGVREIGLVELRITINKKALTVTNASPGPTKTYDGNTNASVVLSYSGLIGGDTLLTVTGTGANDRGTYYKNNSPTKDVGEGLTVKYTGLSVHSDQRNYYLGNANSVISDWEVTNGVITPKSITVTVKPYSKTYNDSNNADGYTLSSSGYYTVTGLIDTTAQHMSATFDTQHVGTSKSITVVFNIGNGAEDKNYTLTGSNISNIENNNSSHRFVVTNGAITKKTLTISYIKEFDKTYDSDIEADLALNTHYKVETLDGDDTFTLKSTPTFDNKHVGTNKTITAPFKIEDSNNGQNYNVVGSGTQTVSGTTNSNYYFTVYAKILVRDITANTGTPVFSRNYDSNTSAFSSQGSHYTLLNTLSNELPVFSSATFDNKNVGSNKNITVLVNFNDGNSGKNYRIISGTATTGNATQNSHSFIVKGQIVAISLTIAKATNYSKPYNKDYATENFAQGTHYTVTGFEGSDDNAILVSSVFSNYNVGDQREITVVIKINDGNAGQNYNLIKEDSYITTGPSPVDQSQGTYSFILNGTITQKEITINAQNTYSRSYNGTTSTAVNSPTNYVIGTFISNSNGTDSFTQISAVFDTKNYGTNKNIYVVIQISDGFSGGNYKLVKGSGDVEITTNTGLNPAFTLKGTITPLAVTISGTSTIFQKTYDATTDALGFALSLHFTTSPLAPNESATATAVFDDKNVGDNKTLTATISIKTQNDELVNSNYTLVQGSNILSINQSSFNFTITGKILRREVTVNATSKTYSKVYNDNPTTEIEYDNEYYTLNNIAPNDESLVSQTSAVFDDKNVNTIKDIKVIMAIGNDSSPDGNYTFKSGSTAVVIDNESIPYTFFIKGEITKKELVIQGSSTIKFKKNYDKTNNTSITLESNHYSITGLEGDDNVSQNSAIFTNVNVGESDSLIIISLNLNDEFNGGNYSLKLGDGAFSLVSTSLPQFSFNIYGKITEHQLIVQMGLNNYTKTYDKNNTTEIALSSNHYQITAPFSTDNIIQVSATFTNINAGDRTILVLINISDGNQGLNYKLVSANISIVINDKTQNFEHSFSIPGVINKRPLYIIFDQSKHAVYSKTYNKLDATVISQNTHYSIENLAEYNDATDTITQRTAVFENVNANTSTPILVTFDINDGNNGLNYYLVNNNVLSIGSETQNSYTFKINGAIDKISLTLDKGTPYSKEYSADKSTTVTFNSGHYSITPLEIPDVLTQTSAEFISKDVSTIDQRVIVVLNFADSSTGADMSANYLLTKGTGTDFDVDSTTEFWFSATITAKPIKITPNSGISKIYGELDPSKFNFSVSGLIGGEQLSSKGTIQRVSGEDVGQYQFTLGTLELTTNGSFIESNYIIDFISNVNYFNIIKRVIEVTITNANPVEKYYDATDSVDISQILLSVNYTLNNIYNNQDVKINIGGAKYANKNASSTSININLNNVTLVGAQDVIKNYSISTTQTILGKINPLPITIVKSSTKTFSMVYNGTTTYSGDPPVKDTDYEILGNGNSLSMLLATEITGANILTMLYQDKNVAYSNNILKITFNSLTKGTGFIDANYIFSSTTLEYSASITAKSITIDLVWDYSPFEYDSTEKTVSVPVTLYPTNILNEKLTAQFIYNDNKKTDAGKYSATVSATYIEHKDSGGIPTNYLVNTTNTQISWDIEKATITVSVGAANSVKRAYDGTTTAQVSGYKLDGIKGSDDIDLSGTSSYDTKDVGVNKNVTILNIKLAGTKSANYNLIASPTTILSNTTLSLAGVGEITPLVITIKMNPSYATITKAYDTTTALPAGIVFSKSTFYSLNGFLNDNEASYYEASFSAPVYNTHHTDATHVSFVTTVLVSSNPTNYPLTNYTFDGISTTIQASITPKVVSVVVLDEFVAITKAYDGLTSTSTVFSKSYYNLIDFGAEESYFDISYDDPYYDTKNTSAIKVTLDIISLISSNSTVYRVTDYNLTTTYLEFDANITPKYLPVKKLAPYSKEYNATTTADLVDGQHFSIDPLISGETYEIISSLFTNKDVSTQDITVILKINDNEGMNYRLSSEDTSVLQVGDEPKNNFSFTFKGDIYKKEITITDVIATDRIYNAETSVTLTGGQLSNVESIDIDNLSVILNLGTVNKNVGSMKPVVTDIELSGSEANNYSLIQPDYVTVNITAKTISVSWDYTQPLKFNGNTQTILATSTYSNGVCTGDVVNLTLNGNTNRNSGNYLAGASINYDSDAPQNYVLDESKDLSYTINPYDITPSLITWGYNGKNYEWNVTGMIYNGSSHSIYVISINDQLYNQFSTGIGVVIHFFGLCSCGTDSSLEYHPDHQLPLSNTGPTHAGSYWVLLSFTGEEAHNFAFNSEGNGYAPTENFNFNSDSVELKAHNDSIIESSLPLTQSAYSGFYDHMVMHFVIGKSLTGVIIQDASPQSVVFNSLDHFVKNLPDQNNPEKVSVLVYLNDEVNPMIQCTFSNYLEDGGVRNAGVYTVVFALNDAASTESSDCDYASGIVPSVSITLTVQPKELKVNLTSTDSDGNPTKIYNANGNYTAFSLYNEVQPNASQDNDYSKISGTDIIVTAAFNSPYVELATTLSFLITGEDSLNYVIYSLPGTITRKQLTITYPSTSTYVYDGNLKTYAGTVSGIETTDTSYIIITRTGTAFTASDSYLSTVTLTDSNGFDRLSNYIITESQLSHYWYITPRTIEITLKSSLSKVYDSKTVIEVLSNVDYQYEPILFTFSANLVAGNFISGRVGVVNLTNLAVPVANAGSHIVYVLDDFTAHDGAGNSNYIFIITNIENADYMIYKRNVTIVYNNTLQSLDNIADQTDILDVTINSINNGLNAGDSINGSDFDTLKSELSVLTVDNNTWRADYANKNLPPYYYYDIDLLGTTADILNNYNFNYPYIRIVGFEIKDATNYEFYVKNLTELLNLRYLVDGLTADGVNYTIYQTANIDGIENYQASIYIPANNLTGKYDGNNFIITNMFVHGEGLFNNINNGSVVNLKLRNMTVSSTSSRVGAIAGTIVDSYIDNISFQGIIFISSEVSELYAGSIIGHSTNSILSDIESVGYMFVKSTIDAQFDNFAVGSIVGGFVYDGQITLNNINSFVEVSITAAVTPQVSGFIGDFDSTLVSINGHYLKNSLSLNGNILSTDQTSALTYSEFVAGSYQVITVLRTYLLKPYLLSDTSDNAGTTQNPYKITSHLQLVLMQIYSWASYELLYDIIIPPGSSVGTLLETYYGESFITNGKTIFSSDVTQDTYLFTDYAVNQVIIRKRNLVGEQ